MSDTYDMKCAVCDGTGKLSDHPDDYCGSCNQGTVRVTREECIDALLRDREMVKRMVRGALRTAAGTSLLTDEATDLLRAALEAGKT